MRATSKAAILLVVAVAAACASAWPWPNYHREHRHERGCGSMEPLSRTAFTARNVGGGAVELSASLPGVSSSAVSVRVAQPGVMEVFAERPVPRHCGAYYGARDVLRRRFSVHESLRDRDLRATLSRDGRLTVLVPQEPPRAPSHCLNVHAPLQSSARAETAPGSLAVSALDGSRPRVFVERPGVLRVEATRHSPRECAGWGAPISERYTRSWAVDASLRDGDLEATFVGGRLDVRLRPAAPKAAAGVRTHTDGADEPTQAPPSVSFREIREELAALRGKLEASERAVEEAAAKAAVSRARVRPLEEVADEDGCPLWFHTPLEGTGDDSCVC